MRSAITILLLTILSLPAFSQHVVSGTVTDQKGMGIPAANVFLEGTYDGATTDETGKFSFTTFESGTKTLVVTYLAFETSKTTINVADAVNKTIRLKESVNTLDAVVVTAGTFEAGDKARVSVLKPLDIVTTAGTAGNIIAALQTLPGTQNVGEDGRLFVRGGEAEETQTFIDGIRVAQPYGATTDNLPTRGRFSPFLFSGISFSTGGYSAEYGEALSSVLLLNTQDEPDQNKTDVSLMTVGLGIGHTQKYSKSSLSFNAAYIDLAPYNLLIPQNVDWNRPYQSLSGESVYRYNFENGLFKLYAAFDASRFDLNQESVNPPYKTRIDLHNNNFYLNTSYRGDLRGNWQLFTGLSYGYNSTKTDINVDDDESSENASHMKLKLRKNFSDRFKLSVGADYFITKFDENFRDDDGPDFNAGYDANIAAAFTEADIFFSKKFAAKAGVRLSNNSLLQETVLSPRVSLAYKISKRGQFSFAYGEFSEAPKVDYLKFSDFHRFDSERASHYILNYQYSRERQTLRAEAYLKDYRDLVKFSGTGADTEFNNTGSGYAQGIDLFWRDGKSVKNLEYWISYSYIDTQRDYRDFPEMATPGFVASHSLSVVTKYWINEWRSQVGFTNSFSSRRPYTNPNEGGFLADKTRTYNSLSFNWAYLLSAQKILYFSVSNVLGYENVFGYEYADTRGTDGKYDRMAITPTADRFFFVGFFWTISDDKKSNQLYNL
jgi:outer membrane cobalamin receptor